MRVVEVVETDGNATKSGADGKPWTRAGRVIVPIGIGRFYGTLAGIGKGERQ